MRKVIHVYVPCLRKNITAQATQAALFHTRAQTNHTAERGPPRQPRIRQLPQHMAEEKAPQTKMDKVSK